jgi:hypothetical protein
MTSFRWHWWIEATGLSGVKACSANGHLLCQIQRLGAPDRGTGLSGASTGLSGVGTRQSGVPERAAAFLQRLVLRDRDNHVCVTAATTYWRQ